MNSTYRRPELTFALLRGANSQRLHSFKNAKGELVHKDKPDWKLSQWGCALAGEVGEALNIIKKKERGDFTQEEWEARHKQELANELADVMIYLDLLALHAGISLQEAVIFKFNVVSNRLSSEIKL